jgi:hypothetical protein
LGAAKADLTFDKWLKIFWWEGQRWVEGMRTGKTQEVGRTELALWGRVPLIRMSDSGYVTTATVRAETPNILIEKVTTDSKGELYETDRITNWEWLDPTQLDTDFWMNPPEDVPIGPGNLKP